jgi:hypothetical protein
MKGRDMVSGIIDRIGIVPGTPAAKAGSQQVLLFADPQIGWDEAGALNVPFRYNGKARAKAVYAKMADLNAGATWGACIGDVVGRGTSHYPPADYSFQQVKEDFDKYLPFGVSQLCVTTGNHDWDYSSGAGGDPLLYGSQLSYEQVFGNRYYGRTRGNIAIYVIGDRNSGGDGVNPTDIANAAIKFFQMNKEKLCILMTHEPDGSVMSNDEDADGGFLHAAAFHAAQDAGKIRLDLWFHGHVSHSTGSAPLGLANPATVTEKLDTTNGRNTWHANVGLHLNRYEELGDAYSITWGELNITPNISSGTSTVEFKRFWYQQNAYIRDKSFSFVFPRLIRAQTTWDYDGATQFDSRIDVLRGPQTILSELRRDPNDTTKGISTTHLLRLLLTNTNIDLNNEGLGILFGVPADPAVQGVLDPWGPGAAIVARRVQTTDSSLNTELEFYAMSGSGLVEADLTKVFGIRSNGLRFGDANNTAMVSGAGSPIGVISAPVGTSYQDYTNGAYWVKASGTGSTGWRPTVTYLSGAASWDPVSLGPSTTTSLQVSVPGASLGDVALAAMDVSLAGASLTAYVRVTDSVTAVLANDSTSTIDVAAGNLNIRVLKMPAL